MASHEFRTPLSTVLSSASLLEKYKTTEEQDKRSRHIDKIKNSVHHLNDILEDFLSLGKLDEGKVRTDIADFDLQEFIREISDEMKGLLKKDQQLLHDYEGKTTIRSDKKLLKNIIINLITNAIKFSEESSPIRIEAKVENDRAVISVMTRELALPGKTRIIYFPVFSAEPMQPILPEQDLAFIL